MSLDAGNDLFAAVRAAILADPDIAGLVGSRVYQSWHNQDDPAPLIRMSIPAARQFEMDGGGKGSETDLWVHIFTVEDSTKSARIIVDRVRTVIDGQPLALLGSDLVSIDYRDTITRRDDHDPRLQMAIVRFLATTTSK